MSDYWMGVLSVPALVLGAAALWLALKAIGWLGERLLVGGVKHLGTQSSKAQRAGMAAVVYSAKRSWFIAPGDLGFIFVMGMDVDEARKAADRLRPRVSLRDISTPTGAEGGV